MMFEAKTYLESTFHNPLPKSVETWTKRATDLIALFENLTGRELTDNEKKTFTWMATGELEVVQMISSFAEEIARAAASKSKDYPKLDKDDTTSFTKQQSSESYEAGGSMKYELLERTAHKGDIVE